jgi:hypothetical protein
VEPVTLVRRERLAHGADEQAVEVRTLDLLEDNVGRCPSRLAQKSR